MISINFPPISSGGGGNVSGSGTIDRLPIWTGTHDLGDSPLYQDHTGFDHVESEEAIALLENGRAAFIKYLNQVADDIGFEMTDRITSTDVFKLHAIFNTGGYLNVVQEFTTALMTLYGSNLASQLFVNTPLGLRLAQYLQTGNLSIAGDAASTVKIGKFHAGVPVGVAGYVTCEIDGVTTNLICRQ